MRSLFLCLAVCSLNATAQAPAPADAKGCVDSKVLTRMPGCVIIRCENKTYSSASMPRTNSERDHNVEGEFEHLTYRCPKEKGPIEVGRNAEAALKAAGFNVFYTYPYATTRFYLTAQKGAHWVRFEMLGDLYDLRVVKQKEMEQVMQANAEGWAQQVNSTGRVSLYGINFDTGKATIRPDSEPVLSEVAKMLQANASWAVLVAGHTDDVGAKEMNLTLSKQRAEAVIAWLAGKGIEKSRLAPAGFGDTRPMAENTDDAGRQKNRRVDLIKLY